MSRPPKYWAKAKKILSKKDKVMNKLITRRLRENAMILRKALSKRMAENDIQALKNEMLLNIYKYTTDDLSVPETG